MDDVSYLKSQFPPDTEPEFFEYMLSLNSAGVQVHAIDEGSVVFPREPLIRLEGPLPVLQLLETPLLALVNFASLVATNAARFRHAVGPNIKLLEFGLRRAQGPDGGLSASRYCFIGGFDATSNVLAGAKFGIPVAGTHAHAFVSSFNNSDEDSGIKLKIEPKDGKGSTCADFVTKCRGYCARLRDTAADDSDAGIDPIKGELVAFATYAFGFPEKFLALVDTYDVLKSGIVNFCAVALALDELGYRSQGIRLDSGDLAYLSKRSRAYLEKVAARFDAPWLARSTIVASNDINEDTLYSLASQGHSIDSFGVGTHLVRFLAYFCLSPFLR